MAATWNQVQDIVDAALELPLEQRAQYLDQVCHDSDIRRSVESLILSYHEADGFLEQPAMAWQMDMAACPEDAESWVGHRIGHYQLVEEIGHGGMGAVYRAVRDDQQYSKQVAIKLLEGGFHSRFALDRFRAERQILATLEHPNIARLLDGGATEEGSPYFVMELVEGQPIDQYCDSCKLGIPDRLRLFRAVCSAVQYAHQHLVIHRDLKPANVLVTAEGTPKLLDFGIAKILDTKAFPREIEPTVPFLRMLTPEYASPEQIRGDVVSTASDVYSLGVILYILLTGHRPYSLDGLSQEAIARQVCEKEPLCPSMIVASKNPAGGSEIPGAPATEGVHGVRAAKPESLSRLLAGDLDNIVLKALSKEPQKRYSSVEQFSEDLRRTLEGLPVSARPDTLVYRAGKFIRRNRLPVGAAILLALSLIGGMAATLWEAHVARMERAKAEKRFNDVREVANSLLFDVHDSIQKLPGTTPARKLIVDRAVRYLDQLSQDAAGDLSLQRELAAAYVKLGRVQGGEASFNLGDTAGAKASFEKAVQINETIVSRKEHTLDDLSHLSQSYLLTNSPENHRKALEICRNLVAAAPGNLDFREDLAKSYRQAGGDLVNHNDLAGGLEEYLQSLKLLQQVTDSDQKNGDYREELSATEKNVGAVLATQGKLSEALEHYRTALRLDEQLLLEHPDDTRLRYDITFTYSDLGYVLGASGNPEAALESYNKALAIRKELAAEDPRNVRVRGGLSRTYFYVGTNLTKLGRDLEALTAFRSSLTIREGLMAADPATRTWQVYAAFSQDYLGFCYSRLAAKSKISNAKRIDLWRQARRYLQSALPVLQEQENRHELVGKDAGEKQRVELGIAKCNSAITQLQKTGAMAAGNRAN